MRRWLAVVAVLAGCQPAVEPAYATRSASSVDLRSEAGDGARIAWLLDDRMVDFRFDGGELDLELYRDGARVVQVVRNRYAVPVTLHWAIGALDNLEPMSPLEGTLVLPASSAPLGAGEPVVLAELAHIDPTTRYHRQLRFRARFGDPGARPRPYLYALPYPRGSTFSVLQGFHGEFSHRGSNEYAVDFDCPVATPVLAARPGIVVAANASAQGSGTSSEFLDDRRTNFVIILHGDGTLGEYMHLSPSGVEVAPGHWVRRGQELGLSGNTGFSSTPHLHFQVMTAAEDGTTKRSFPFELAVGPSQSSPPIQGKRYFAWE